MMVLCRFWFLVLGGFLRLGLLGLVFLSAFPAAPKFFM